MFSLNSTSHKFHGFGPWYQVPQGILGKPRFPLKGSFQRGCRYIGIDIDVEKDIDLEAPWGTFEVGLVVGLIRAWYLGLYGILSGLTKSTDRPSIPLVSG